MVGGKTAWTTVAVQSVAKYGGPLSGEGGEPGVSLVEWERKEGISILTLNRPEVFNALNMPALEQLREIAEELRHSRATRVVVVTGAGEKAFCAGADLKERRDFTEDQVRRYIHMIRETFHALASLPRPVIAAVNGVAFGGGMELALACDLRIADEHAVLGLTETSLGIIPGAGGTQRLARLIGTARAKELIFTAKRITAREGETLGLLNRVVTGGTVMEAAMEVAAQINENAPLALAQAKYAIDHGSETDLATGLAMETKAYEVLIPTKDRLEGLQAFKEKRKPIYLGE
ncbi:enoyl-CoA hydratase [Kroppenstedtia eburnea]|nr:enoyl-CoA hydratase [Kroppenstedtia eburnea]